MEVLVGPTFSIEAPAPPAYVRDRSGVPAKDKVVAAASPCLFAKDEEEEGGPGLHLGMSGNSPEDSSDSSSSIGSPDGSEEEDDAVSSEGDGLGLRSLGSLEDSLPIKRGLSNHYTGKSKSFGNLADVSTVKELKKPDNPFNKRRRVLIASKLSRRSSFYSWQNPKSMPLLALPEEEEDEVNPEDNNGGQQHNPEAAAAKPKLQERNNKNLLKASRFKSQSCFSLTDLQDEDQ